MESKIEHPELQKPIMEGVRDLELIEGELQMYLAELKDEIGQVEMDVGLVEHMEGNNEHAKEYLADTGKSAPINTYSEDDIEEAKGRIERSMSKIKKIHEDMTSLALNKIHTEDYIEEFEKLETAFRALVSRIEPEQTN